MSSPRTPSSQVRFLAVAVAVAVGIGLALSSLDPSDALNSPPGPAREFKEVAARREYRDYLTRELLAGHLSLEFVADEFLRVSTEGPAHVDTVLRSYAGADDRERSARHVLEYTRTWLHAQGQGSEAMDRLEADFTEVFGHPPGPLAALPQATRERTLTTRRSP